MQIRILAGCQRLITAAAVASLMIASGPANAATQHQSKAGGLGLKPLTGAATTHGLDNSDIKRPVLYPRSNYVWPFAAGPTYGEVDSSRWNDAGVLHTAVGSFDLTRGLPNFPAQLMAVNRLGTQSAQYFLLQVRPEAFSDGSFDQMKTALEAAGGAIVQQMPVAAFVVRANQAGYAALQGNPGIIALEPYHPAFKLSPDIGRVPLPDPQKALSDSYSLELNLFPGEDATAVAQVLTGLGANVTRTAPGQVFVDVNRSKLAAVAGIEAVQSVFEQLPIFLMGEETTCTVQTGRYNNGAIPYHDAGVDGGGGVGGTPQILMVLDSGIQVDAGDLSNTHTDGASTTPIGATHRKVLFYGTTNPFGGSGDLLGCDAAPSGGFTHGHTVSATALGNGTAVPVSYGAGWQALDANQNPWHLDGVAPRAKLVAYDASLTPASGSCEDPGQGGISPGTLYSAPSTGALADGYARGARVVNFSWGTNANVYDGNATQTDSFIFDKGDALVFIAAGNNGADTGGDFIGEPFTVGAPGTTKNGVSVGASFDSNDQFNVNAPNNRATFSSNGPASSTATLRVAPMIMAPGTDSLGGQGLNSEYNCRTTDNDQNNPVQCDIVSALHGTSFATPAAAGAALLIRDYFAQGLYPDGTSSNPGNASDKVANISGALIKAILIDSADWMHAANSNNPGGNLSYKYRFNNEQGYGRVELTNALPLQTYSGAVTGLIVADGGIGGGTNNTTLNTTLGSGASTSYALNVCDRTQPLNVGLAWMEAAGDAVTKNLDLELIAPSGRKYLGNFYTDDTNRNKVLDSGEDCTYTGLPWPPNSVAGVIDASPWSLPVAGTGVSCTTAHTDAANPTEGIHLSPDPALNGIVDNPSTGATDEGADNQIEVGQWTVNVKAGAFSGTQNYALAISGGVCLGSSVRIQKVLSNNQLGGGTFVCNDSAVVTVNEVATAGDPAVTLTTSEISSRTKIEVVDAGVDGVFGTGDDVVTDTEQGLAFTDLDGAGAGLAFQSAPILLTDGTAPDPGNGALDVRSGQQIRVTYQDEEPLNTIDPNGKRVNTGLVDCRASISAGGTVFGQFGKDTFTFVSGGCERDARGYFTFGFPDKYIDAGEVVGYLVAFQSAETSDTLKDVTVSLKALAPDADSPVTCKPNTADCTDPNRQNNSPSPFISVLDSPKVIGTLAPANVATVSFTVKANASISGVQSADMLIGVSAKTAGKPVESYAVQRETLNADAVTFYYSTDFPTGGASINYDINNNEILETVTNDPKSFLGDYIFETQSFSDLTVGGFNSAASLMAPWNFDTNNGGFTSGLENQTTSSTISSVLTNWGEDKNFNNKLDGLCSTVTSPRLVCTKGDTSQNCNFCANDHSIVCSVAGDCASVGGACSNFGTCTYTLDEDRDAAGTAGNLDQNWSTNGGCGWQTKGAGTTGGIWHTGTIRATSISSCLAASTTSARCQQYEILPAGDLLGNKTWWELLLTPILNKVNQCPAANGTNCPRADAAGDPVYQVAITDWAWNMEMDFPDQNTFTSIEFDTDIDKTDGADLFNDFIATDIFLSGPQGAISGGNGPITGGFNMFAPVVSCVDTDGKGQCSVTTTTSCFGNADCPVGQTCVNFPDHCGTVAGATCTTDSNCAGVGTSRNGTVGNNRVGVNNCAFETSTAAVANLPWGLATPPDDDAANGYCNRSDSLNGFDKSVSCTSNNQCTIAGAPYTTCNLSNHPGTATDAFVQANGPGRNFGIQVPNGPDMRFSTLEDFYGDTGNRFRAAFGILNFDPTQGTANGSAGYGLGVDDMFISWKETRLDEDTHDCTTGGQCADVEMKQTLSYDGNSLLSITITDPSPYDLAHPVNDCNDNGTYTDTGLCGGTGPVCSNDSGCSVGVHCVGADDTDCNDNGTRDITAHVSSPAEYPGELLALDETSTPGVWKGNLPYSTTYDSVGTLFLQLNGNDNPVATVQYDDRNDGTGQRCSNNLDAAKNGLVAATTAITLTTGRLTIKGYRLVLVGTPGVNGDDDGYADRNETEDMYVTFSNKTGFPLDNILATLGTSDTKIDCISRPVVSIPHFDATGAGATVETPTPFRFKVGNTNRVGVNDVYNVTFAVTVRSDTFDTTTRKLSITIDLNLNASGGGATQQFIEDFEASSGLGKFTTDNLDAGKNSLALSDGMRCQYNNPDFVNTNGPGNTDCFLGFVGDAAAGVTYWHLHKATQNGTPRAYTGTQSLHLGIHPIKTNSQFDTTPLKKLSAVKTVAPIYLPAAGSVPELSYKQQVSLADSRLFNVTPGEAADRAVVEVQLADPVSSNPIGNWIKIYPYQNSYDSQGTNDFFNCTFDPTDDGNNEDSFFFPTDPNRTLGPSSTCFPEFTFSDSGDIDWRLTADPSRVGLSEGPGLTGSVDRGTWIQPFFNLSSFAGRAIRLRFVETAIEVGEATSYAAFGFPANVTQDDGWYIDDVRIPAALASPVNLAVDNNNNTVVAGSCAACTDVEATLTASPTSLSGPGQVVTLDASGSTIDSCPSGIPRYQFWINSDGDSVVGSAGDTLLRDYTDSAVFTDAPLATTQYGVRVRCSSQPSCDDTGQTHTPFAGNGKLLTVVVTCPATGNLKANFQVPGIGVNKLGPATNSQVVWPVSTTADVIRGNLNTLRTSHTFNGSVLACNNNVVGTSAPADNNDPGAGNGYYFLARPSFGGQYCNQAASYSDGASTAARDTQIALDPNACP